MGRRRKRNTNGNVQPALVTGLDELRQQITDLTTTISKMDKSPEKEPEPEDNKEGKYRLLHWLKIGCQTLITWIPVISMLLSAASLYISTQSFKTSLKSYNDSRTEWLESGPQFRFIVRAVTVDEASGVPVEGSNAGRRIHYELYKYEILLSNTGRLKATVLSVQVKTSQTGDLKNQCTNPPATIEPGESRLFLFGTQKMKPDVDHLTIFVNTADGQKAEARKLGETDKTSTDLAYSRALDELEKENNPVCNIYMNGDKEQIKGTEQKESSQTQP